MNSDESWLTFDEEAKVLHNKVSFLILYNVLMEAIANQLW